MTAHRGMTLSEKILAVHAGRDSVEPGELLMARVDLVLGNDITAPLAIAEFERAGARKVFDPARVVLVPDHFTPNKDIRSAEMARVMREFARKHSLIHYFEVGRAGIEHALVPEKGLVGPGDLVVGADSHTCTCGALGAFATGVGSTDLAAAMALGEVWLKVPGTMKFAYRGRLQGWAGAKDLILYTLGKIGVDGARYRAMEFTGEAVSTLSMDGRFTMANMAVEAGAKNGIFAPDEVTLDYLATRRAAPGRLLYSDHDAVYEVVYEFDASEVTPQVALPHSPDRVAPVADLGEVPVDQVVIGSCTNGRLDDLRVAAAVLRGNGVNPRVRLIIIPATQEVYLAALREGLIELFLEAGAVVSTPTCGPCLGGHMGVLAAGETAVSTTNRNFAGRMGDPTSRVYLAGPAVAAASAVKGRLALPEEVVRH